MPFEPEKHFRQYVRRQKTGERDRSGKDIYKEVATDYLDVRWRLVWLREQQPDAVIATSLITHEPGYALFQATVTLPSGGSATGWGSETKEDFGDYLEKAETKALGRALAALGYGTAHAAELDEGGSVADAPVERRSSAAANAPIPPLPAANLATHGVMYEQAKGRENPPTPPAPVPAADPELAAAKLVLKAVVGERGLTWPAVVDVARQAWPHITTVELLGTLTTFQLSRLTEVLTGASIIDGGGRIVPAPEPEPAPERPTIAGELSAAMR